MITRATLAQHRDAILELARRHGATNVRVIGSVARDEAGSDSDLDLLVRFEPERTLFDHGALIMDLQDLLRAKVDVISEKGIRPRWRESILREATPL